MIESIKINFSFGKLLRNLDNILVQNIDKRKKVFRNGAKEIIKSGKLRKNTKGTLALRKKGVAKGGESSSTKPLMHTNDLLNSIKTTEEGIEFLPYGEHHLSDTKVMSNKWTKKFIPNAIGKTIKKRNFLPLTPKGRYSSVISDRMKKLDTQLYKRLNKALRK